MRLYRILSCAATPPDEHGCVRGRYGANLIEDPLKQRARENHLDWFLAALDRRRHRMLQAQPRTEARSIDGDGARRCSSGARSPRETRVGGSLLPAADASSTASGPVLVQPASTTLRRHRVEDDRVWHGRTSPRSCHAEQISLLGRLGIVPFQQALLEPAMAHWTPSATLAKMPSRLSPAVSTSRPL